MFGTPTSVAGSTGDFLLNRFYSKASECCTTVVQKGNARSKNIGVPCARDKARPGSDASRLFGALTGRRVRESPRPLPSKPLESGATLQEIRRARNILHTHTHTDTTFNYIHTHARTVYPTLQT